MIKIHIINNYKRIENLKGKSLTSYWVKTILGLDDDVEIKRTDRGKPYVDRDLEFSISHSGDVMVVACSNKPIGIDLQEARTTNYEKLAERYFTKKECESINSSEDFFKIWTRKEAFAKYTGEGLSVIMSKVDVLSETSVKFAQFMIDDMYCCLCAEEIEEYDCIRES